jgi:hypothetical protein
MKYLPCSPQIVLDPSGVHVISSTTHIAKEIIKKMDNPISFCFKVSLKFETLYADVSSIMIK